mgnify:FL=1
MVDARGSSVNARLQDRAIAHAIYFQRLKTGTVRDIVGFLNAAVLPELEREIALRLAAGEALSASETARLEAVRDAVRTIAFAGFAEARRRIVDALEEIAVYEAEWQVATVARILPPLNISFDAPSPATLRALVETRPFEGKVLGEWWSGVAADAQVRIDSVVREGIASGRTTGQIVARITGDEGVGDAPFRALRRNAEAVVRTATQEVSTAARMETYRENDDLVKGWQFVATLDARTTLICASEDGKVYPVGEGRPPPLHFGCRSTTVPVMKSFAELGFAGIDVPAGSRASMDGEVAEKTTYDEWLRGQPRAVQDEALGPERAALFRGGLKIERFVDAGLRPLTLDELRALEAS